MYYTGYDWLSDTEIDDMLPEDDVPEDLVVQASDLAENTQNFDGNTFVEWLNEGRHNCDVAHCLLLTWLHRLRGSDDASTMDLFRHLCQDEAAETRTQGDADVFVSNPQLSVSFVARLGTLPLAVPCRGYHS